MRYAIWYHLYNLKNVKNTHGGVLLLVKLQAATLLKVTLLYWCFSRFLNCTNGIISQKTSHIYVFVEHTVANIVLLSANRTAGNFLCQQ